MQQPSQSQAEHDADELAERFFSQPPEAWELSDEPEPWRPAPLTQGERLAMLATVVPVVLGVSVAIGLFVFSDPPFASAEPQATTRAAAEADEPAPVAAQDATQHGLTALAKASPIAVPALEAPPPQPLPGPAAREAAPSEAKSASATAPSVAPPASSAVASTPPAAAPKAATPSARPASAGSPLARARKALDAGKPGEARALATEAISRSPNAAAAYIVLAGALDALGDRAGMQATFRTCAERATDSLASACRSLVR